jgi:selenocysteine lyase/cysteine desulfurase
MFNVEGRTPDEVAGALAEEKVAVWHGNYYAYELERFLGLEPGGAVRAGLVHYNSEEDVDQLLSAVERL